MCMSVECSDGVTDVHPRGIACIQRTERGNTFVAETHQQRSDDAITPHVSCRCCCRCAMLFCQQCAMHACGATEEECAGEGGEEIQRVGSLQQHMTSHDMT